VATNLLRDPLQGYDIQVTTTEYDGNGTRLMGAFNTFMWRVVSQSEVYLTLNQRIPRHLDGEILTVWSLDQGLVNLDVVSNTFGTLFAEKLGKDRPRAQIIPRQRRFQLHVTANLETIETNVTNLFGEQGFNRGIDSNGNPVTDASYPGLSIKLHYSRVDTLTFGVAPGRAVAANSWQGTAESCDDGSATVKTA
jgi:hypothetical protein